MGALSPPALLYLPSPASPTVFELGPLTLTYFGLLIALGMAAGVGLTVHELRRRGLDGTLALEALFFVVPAGVVGARLYYVVVEWGPRFSRTPASALEFWTGGLGVYGAIAGGLAGLLVFAYLRGVGPLRLADAAAPGLALAQAIGRWGNYFNQELFGRPSDLPWAVRVDPHRRPPEYADAQTFHPAFLYESVWDLLVCLVLLLLARRLAGRLRDGSLFLLYVALYAAGRLLVETVRIDEAFLILGSVRGELVLSALLLLLASLLLFLRRPLAPRGHDTP